MRDLRTDRQLWTLVSLTAVGMTMVVPFDHDWTLLLVDHYWKPLTDLVGQTLFEGQPVGVIDFSNIFLLAVLSGYVLVDLKPARFAVLQPIRPLLGFILAGAVVSCFGIVHCLKTALGRARPERIVYGGLPYSEWFQFGPFSFPDSAVNGSFTSGHTAIAFVYMTLAYVLAGDPANSRARRTIGLAVGGAALVNAAVVSVGRVMSLSHWVSDSLASILFSWIIFHILYHYVLAVPRQRRQWARTGSLPKTPVFWELRLAGWLLLAFAGMVVSIAAIRASTVDGRLLWAVMVPSGAAAMWWAGQRIGALRAVILPRPLPTARPPVSLRERAAGTLPPGTILPG
jgi:hypothetical protein